MALPNVTDLKTHLNYPDGSDADDEELEAVLDAAIEVVAGIVGPLEAETVTEIQRGVNSPLLVLRRMPAVALTTISARYSAADTTELDPADYELDPATGIVRRYDGSGFYGTYVVEYTAGAADVPASVKLAILIIASHLFETQRVPMQDAAPAGFGNAEVVVPLGRGFAIPTRAVELLQPYATGPVIA